MRRFLCLWLFVLGFCVLASGAVVSESFASKGSTAPAYKEIEVLHGGTVAGKVTLTGPVPPPRVFRLDLSPLQAGGPFKQPGDFLYMNHRMAYMEAGQWGFLRVLKPNDGKILSLGKGRHGVRKVSAESMN